MSFIYSQALVEESWPANNLDTDASAPLNGSPTPKPSLWHDKTMAVSRLSRFGMTCKPLTDGHGAALLTLWLEASRARTYPSPAKVRALMAPSQECGDTWRGSLARFDPDTFLWRTAQPSLLEDLGESSVTWPRSGMTAAGRCWALPMLGRRIKGTDFGWWPTPCATDNSNRMPSDNIHISASGLPKHIALNGEKSQMRLSQAVQMWPTPTVCGNYNRKGASATSGDGLITALRTWPTPIRRDSRTVRGGGKNDEFHRVGTADNASSGIGTPDGWPPEPDVGRMVDGVAFGMDRLKALGNGQVPACAAAAWRILSAP